MPDNKKAPRCPYCDSKMRHKQGLVCRTLHWYECTNAACESESPARNTAERAYEAAMQAVSKWQLVSETLPSHEMYVLGFDEKKECDYPYLCFYPDTQEFCDEMYPGKPVNITHWMPYPEAPKEDYDDE
jgi:hypothetical protein|nr:MAG TPA: Protein of unknown function (DUF551) [Caudoviricetes sp.]